jgi:hypothetical protein
LGKRLGLIIGINNYQDTTFQSLKFAEKDARVLAQWLVNSRGGNWNPSDVQLLLGQQASTELIKSLIIHLCLSVADQGDLVLIYFAGHAFLDETNGEGYLAFTNSYLQQPETALSLHSLFNETMLPSHAAQIVLVVDCFQTGSTWNKRKTSQFDFKPLPGFTLQNALKQMQGRLLYCSCRGNEYAPEVGEKNIGKLLYYMILGLSGPATDPTSGRATLQNLHAFLLNSLDEQHQPQVFGQEHRPIVLVGDMPSFVYRHETISVTPPASPALYSTMASPPMSNQAVEYLSQSSISIASAQMPSSAAGQSSDARSRSASTSASKQGGIKSFLIGAVIQIFALLIGVIGASILIIRPQLPIIIPFLLESIALAILCVNAARGTYLYGIQRFLLTFATSLIALGILGGLYRFGYHWLINRVITFPPLIVPVLFLGFWLVAAAVLPLLCSLGGFIGRIIIGMKGRSLSS